jgi:gliding motility-associated-like protein
MEDKDFIKDLFQERLKHFESPVDASAWTNISSQLSSSVAGSSAAGFGVASKIIAATVIVGAVLGGVYLYNNNDSSIPNPVDHSELYEPTVPQAASLDRTEEIGSFHSNNIVDKKENSTAVMPELNDFQASSLNDKEIEDVIIAIPVLDPISVTEPSEEAKILPFINPISNEVDDDKVQKEEVLEEQIVVEDAEKEITLFNIITPNNDGVNDFLFIELDDVKEFNLVILNSKHEVVFKTADPDFKWYGYSMFGEKVPSGEYFYFVTGVYNSGKNFQKHSSLSIME